MRYLIDGYNVTRCDPATRDLPLEEQRTALETRMRTRGAALLGKGTYTIIWDGASGAARNNVPAGSTYTRRPTADDAIVARVRASKERIGVVTSDNELANRCHAVALHGVDVLPSSRLFESSRSPRNAKGGSRKPMSRDVGIPADANKINEELKRLWGIED